MKNKKTLLMMLAFVFAFCFTSCKDDSDEEKTSLTVNVYDLVLGSVEGATSTFTLVCNNSWTITGMPEWLDLSSTKGGAGTTPIVVTAKSTNNSAEDRTAIINVVSGSVTVDIEVTQRADLVGDCEVIPTEIMVMNESVAFDFEYGKKVSYYYYGYIESKSAGSMTDEDIEEFAQENFKRYTPDEDLLGVIDDLDYGTSYEIICFGYDSKGNRGEMSRVRVTTKSDITNRPRVDIYDISYSDNYWYWETLISPYARRYYQIFADGYYAYLYAMLCDAEIAWSMKEYIDSGDYKPIVNSGSWTADRSTGANDIYIAAWAVGAEENFSGVLDIFAGSISENSVTRTVAEKTSEKIKVSSKSMLRELIGNCAIRNNP